MAMPKIMLSISPTPPPPPKTTLPFFLDLISRRSLILTSSLVTLSSAAAAAALPEPLPPPPPPPPPPSKSFLSGIANTKSWFQFFGDGFTIRVPPKFEDITEPEDYNAGLSLYGDKAKPKTFAARFASSDGSEVLSVVIRPSNQLKITFLEAQDIADFGSLKEASKIFVPGGTRLYSARTFKIKEEEGYRYPYVSFDVPKNVNLSLHFPSAKREYSS